MTMNNEARRSVTIACLKLETELWNPEANLRPPEPMIRQATGKGVDFMVTPEPGFRGLPHRRHSCEQCVLIGPGAGYSSLRSMNTSFAGFAPFFMLSVNVFEPCFGASGGTCHARSRSRVPRSGG
jgi:hypothetical protein